MTGDRESKRNGSIDLLRWLGAIGIVWFHMRLPGGWIGYAALPFFVVLLVYFGPEKPLRDRAIRLLTPWLIWSAVYALVVLAQALLKGLPLREEFHAWMLLTGPVLHLWFLPFSFLFLVVFRGLRGPILAVTALIGAFGTLWASNHLVLPIPLSQWSFAFPAAFLGLAMFRFKRPVVLAVGTAAVCMLLFYGLGWSVAVPQLLIASVALAAAFAFPLPASPPVVFLSGLALGVYLMHPLTMAVGERLGLHEWPLLGFVLIVSHLGTLVLKRVMPRAV